MDCRVHSFNKNVLSLLSTKAHNPQRTQVKITIEWNILENISFKFIINVNASYR